MKFPNKPNLTVNEYADFWCYNIGVNIIPADTRNKKPLVKWSEYQNKPIPEWQHNQWKKSGMFCKGLAIILGRVWHRSDRKSHFFLGIDKDNEKAIIEFCNHNGKTTTLRELASKTLVEQHPDDQSKAHSYYYTTRPIMSKSSDSIFSNGINDDLIPALEVKSQGNCLMYCTPSVHKNGTRYTILGTFEPATLNDLQTNELELHIDIICKKYGITYLSNKNDKSFTPIKDLFQSDYRILEGHNRHEALLRVMESLIIRNSTIFSLEKIKDLSRVWSNIHCIPPLDDREFEKQWKSALEYIKKQKLKSSNKEADHNQNHTGNLSSVGLQHEYDSPSIQELCEKIMSRCIIRTLADTEEMLYYENGTYHPGGERVVKVELEKIAGYSIKNNQRNEIIAHIKYRTIVNREEFDIDIAIINVKNGLLNILTGEIKPHSHEYLSLVQLPVKYDPNALCSKIIRFLTAIQAKEGISTIVRWLGYCIYRSACYEKALLFVGSGKNGKSVLIKLIESFVGQENISHASLQELTGDRFASADLFCKFVNTFADLEADRLTSTGIFKSLVSGDSIRAQRKHQQPFSFRNYSKLIFSTNTIPESQDRSYAYYRRWIILPFDALFDGEDDDPDLINKLTTEEELSGLLNLALKGLDKLIKEGGFKDISVEKVKQQYEHKASIVKQFVEEQCVVNLNNPDYFVSTQRLKELFRIFCKSRGLKPLDENILGKELLQFGISKDRIMKNNQRDYYYIGIIQREQLQPRNNTLITV